MAFASTERFLDQDHQPWTVTTVCETGGAYLVVTDQHGRRHRLTPIPQPLTGPRPSVDSEEPLPLDLT